MRRADFNAALVLKQMRKLRHVGRDAPRLVAAEQLSGRSPPRLFLEIDIGERLPVVIAHHEAGGLFFDRLRRLEAALRQRLNNALDQSQNDQQDNRADEGVYDRGNNTAADYDADLRQQPASDQTAENPNDDVADQPVATAFQSQALSPNCATVIDARSDRARPGQRNASLFDQPHSLKLELACEPSSFHDSPPVP